MENKITAKEGHVFVFGDSFVTTIYLGKGDSASNYPEITRSEMLTVLAERKEQGANGS